MWFRCVTILIILLCFCWLFKPIFIAFLRSVKKVKQDIKKIK